MGEPLRERGPRRARAIGVFEPEDEDTEDEWLHLGAQGPPPAPPREPERDVYTLAHGQPFATEG